MTAEAFAKLCLSLFGDAEDTVAGLQEEPFCLSEPEARALVATTVRSMQEVEIENAHDDLEDAHA